MPGFSTVNKSLRNSDYILSYECLSLLTISFHLWQSGDKFVVKVRVSDTSAVRAFIEHFIFKLPNQEVYPSLLRFFFLLHNVIIVFLLSLLLSSSSLFGSPSLKLRQPSSGSTRITVQFVYLRRRYPSSICSPGILVGHDRMHGFFRPQFRM